MAQLTDKSRLIVEYEETCQSPSGFYANLKNKYKENAYELSDDVNLPKAFSPSNEIRISDTEFQKLADAYDNFIKTETKSK